MINDLKNHLNNILAALKEELSNLHANRPTTKLVENIKVDYMGTPLTIKEVASISIELPRDIIITPWDKGAIPAIEKGIQDSSLGSPVNQGNLIRVKLPDITMERRAELIKIVKSSSEQARIKVRLMRDDFNKKTKDIKDEDEKFRTKDSIQKEVDRINNEIEQLVSAKSKEIES